MLAAALLLSVLVGTSPGYSAQAAPTIGPGLSVTVSRVVVPSGGKFTATARSRTPCHWIVTWNGIRRGQVSTVFSTTFTAPRVAKRTRIALHATCFAVPAAPRPAAPRHTAPGHRQTHPLGSATPRPPSRTGSSASQQIFVKVPVSQQATVVITVLPPGGVVSPPHQGHGHGHGHGGHGGLPNTGGPDLWKLLVGLGSAVLGAVLVGLAQWRGRQHGVPA